MQIDPRYEILLSRVLAALRPVIIAFLVMNGAALAQGATTPISFCNVLFVGDICAALVVLTLSTPAALAKDISTLSYRSKLGLIADGGLTALNSALIYTGLEYTSSTNAILLGRLAPVLYAISGALIFRRAISRNEWVGFSFIIIGVLLVALIESNFAVNKGDALILASTAVFAASAVIGKHLLGNAVPLRAIVFSRNGVSSIVFFVIANIVFGPHHFADAFSGKLWILMTVYAGLVIVVSQFLWFEASSRLDSISVGRWATPAPAIGVFAAAALNRQWPSSIQVVGLAVIMIGVSITAFGTPKKLKPRDEALRMAELSTGASSSISPVT